MARHDQRPDKNSNWICLECKNLNCRACVDVLRAKVIDVERLVQLCKCKHAESFAEV